MIEKKFDEIKQFKEFLENNKIISVDPSKKSIWSSNKFAE